MLQAGSLATTIASPKILLLEKAVEKDWYAFEFPDIAIPAKDIRPTNVMDFLKTLPAFTVDHLDALIGYIDGQIDFARDYQKFSRDISDPADEEDIRAYRLLLCCRYPASMSQRSLVSKVKNILGRSDRLWLAGQKVRVVANTSGHGIALGANTVLRGDYKFDANNRRRLFVNDGCYLHEQDACPREQKQLSPDFMAHYITAYSKIVQQLKSVRSVFAMLGKQSLSINEMKSVVLSLGTSAHPLQFIDILESW